MIIGDILGEDDLAIKTYEEFITENIVRKLPIKPNDLTFGIISNERHAKGYHKKMSFSNLILGFMIDKSKFILKYNSLL